MKKAYLVALSILLIVSLRSEAMAYGIKDNPTLPVYKDFVVGPAKNELFVNPGETVTRELYIINRLGKTVAFKIAVEDFTGSNNPDTAVVLLGEQKGLYSLRDYLKPELKEFTLAHGQQIFLGINISVPQDIEPGGRYGAAIVSSDSPTAQSENEGTGVALISRIASLFFVRVAGEIQEVGYLKSFRMINSQKIAYESGPAGFELSFQNDGNIHLVPYGIVEIRNIIGQKVGEIEIDPFFVMPLSLRSREISWDKKGMLGKYSATLNLNRGYEDIIDKKSVDFWVIPWKNILIVLSAALILIIFWKKILKKLSIK